MFKYSHDRSFVKRETHLPTKGKSMPLIRDLDKAARRAYLVNKAAIKAAELAALAKTTEEQQAKLPIEQLDLVEELVAKAREAYEETGFATASRRLPGESFAYIMRGTTCIDPTRYSEVLASLRSFFRQVTKGEHRYTIRLKEVLGNFDYKDGNLESAEIVAFNAIVGGAPSEPGRNPV